MWASLSNRSILCYLIFFISIIIILLNKSINDQLYFNNVYIILLQYHILYYRINKQNHCQVQIILYKVLTQVRGFSLIMIVYETSYQLSFRIFCKRHVINFPKKIESKCKESRPMHIGSYCLVPHHFRRSFFSSNFKKVFSFRYLQ